MKDFRTAKTNKYNLLPRPEYHKEKSRVLIV